MNETDIVTYVINLDSSTDRLASVQAALAEANIDFIRVAAFDGRLLDMDAVEDYDDKKTRKWLGRSLNGGEIGCYKSHVDCLQRFLASNAKYALVFEDDINIAPDILASVSKAVSFLDDNEPDWYIIHLATPLNEPRRRHKYSHLYTLNNERSLFASHRFHNGALGLLWSRKGARIILDKIYPIIIPFDEVTKNITLSSGRGFSIYPPLITHTSIKSDIDHDKFTREMLTSKSYHKFTNHHLKMKFVQRQIGYLHKVNFVQKKLQKSIIARIRKIANIWSF